MKRGIKIWCKKHIFYHEDGQTLEQVPREAVRSLFWDICTSHWDKAVSNPIEIGPSLGLFVTRWSRNLSQAKLLWLCHLSNKIALYKSCLVLLYIRFFYVCHFYYLLPLFHILSLVSIEAFLKVVIPSSTFQASYSELILDEMLPVTPCGSVSPLSWYRILG